MKSALVILAHPNFSQSNLNKALIQAASNVEQVEILDLYQAYPDGMIDIDREQQRLLEADIVVFQHPFYWYSAPALLKEWLDLVLQFNFAYGPNGNELADKQWLSVVTTGAGEHAYSEEGHNRFSMRQFLLPFEQTAYLCGMDFLPPFVLHSARKLSSDPLQLQQVCAQYQQLLTELVNQQLPEQCLELDVINQRWEQN